MQWCRLSVVEQLGALHIKCRENKKTRQKRVLGNDKKFPLIKLGELLLDMNHFVIGGSNGLHHGFAHGGVGVYCF